MKTIPLEEALKLAAVPMLSNTSKWKRGGYLRAEQKKAYVQVQVYLPDEMTDTESTAHLAALLAHFYNHGPELVEALKPLAAIAKNWESNGLDETRPDWGDTKDKILNLDLVCGRGGKTLLRMKDVFLAAEAIAKASTVQMP